MNPRANLMPKARFAMARSRPCAYSFVVSRFEGLHGLAKASGGVRIQAIARSVGTSQHRVQNDRTGHDCASA
jgi:hypothetical protein